MTKDDLRRYGSIRRELAAITRRLHELEESKGCHSVTYGDSPHQRGEPLSEAQRYVEKKETLERLYRRKQCILLEEQAAVENAIDALPPELRRLMRLRYLDGKSWSECARRMGYADESGPRKLVSKLWR